MPPETPRTGTLAQGDAAAVALAGHVDHASHYGVVGWAQDTNRPDAVVAIEVVAGGQVVARALADRPRPDLLRDGLGGTAGADARHGFVVRFAMPLAVGRAHLLEVRRAGDMAALSGTPLVVEALGGSAEDFAVALACLHHDPDAAGFLAGLVDAALTARTAR